MPFLQIRKWSVALASALTLILLILCFQYTISLFDLGNRIHPLFGYLLGGVFAVAFLAVLIIPWVVFYRYPKALKPPKSEAELTTYRNQLRLRLMKNQHLKSEGFPMNRLETDEGLQEALGMLDRKAQEVISKAAKYTFSITAVSQNGKLDGIAVLYTQGRMIWQIAKVYYQRPHLADMLLLYRNVAGSALFSVGLEELDLTDRVEPLVNALLKNTAGKAVPFASGVSQLILDSLLEGTINAFFTLRVGVLARRYCVTYQVLEHQQLRRKSYQEAAVLLSKVVVGSSAELGNAVFRAIKKTGTDSLKAGANSVTETIAKWKDAVLNWSKRNGIEDPTKEETD